MTTPTVLWISDRLHDEEGYFTSWVPLQCTLVKEHTPKILEVSSKDSKDTHFYARDDFFETEEDCWNAIKLDLVSEIMDKERKIESLQRELQALKDYQSSLLQRKLL